jgi:hydrogenase nickel incorporation protein HypA/HybF
MHEYSIVQALLERVEREARAHHATRVHRVEVSIGDLAGVEVELLRTAYDTIRHRTLCDAAELAVHRVPARWQCSQCGEPIRTGVALRCASCGAAARLITGDEIMLDRIEMEAE